MPLLTAVTVHVCTQRMFKLAMTPQNYNKPNKDEVQNIAYINKLHRKKDTNGTLELQWRK